MNTEKVVAVALVALILGYALGAAHVFWLGRLMDPATPSTPPGETP